MTAPLAAAVDYSEQAAVTNWPARIGLVLLMIAIIGVALWGMRRGWQHRRQRQSWIVEPPEAPATEAGMSGRVPGLFIGTSLHGDWMDRVVVFDLGVRSRAVVSWGPQGVWFEREGARDLFIPSDAVAGVRADRGTAGTVRERDSVVVVTWRVGDAVLDTGFRADEGTGHLGVLDGLVATFATGGSGAGQT